MNTRILHVIDSMDPASGGAPAAIRQLLPHLRDMGADGEVVCFDGRGRAAWPDEPFPVHRLGPGSGPWRYHPGFAGWLRRELPRFGACIVHGLWLYNGHATTKTVLALRRTGAATAVHVMPHGMLDPWFQRARHRRLKALRNRIWWHVVEASTVRRCDGLLFTTEEERRLASTTFPGYRPAAEAVIGLGTDAPPDFHDGMREAFRAACPGLGERPYLLFMGRIDAKKGLDILLRAWSDLVGTESRRGDMPALVVAGPGWETPYGRGLLSSISADHGLRTHMLSAGMLSGAAKWGALYGCDAFVLPSHQENFGVAVAEALSCGRPALLARGVNTYITVTNMRAGLSCEHSRAEVSRMLAGWLSLDGAERTRMSAAAWRTWQEHFTSRAAARRLLGAVFPRLTLHGD